MNNEQILDAQKSNIEAFFGLTNKAFEGVEKLVELNVQAAKTALQELADNAKAALAVKDAQGLFQLQASLVQPVAEKAAAYGRHVMTITTEAGDEVRKVAEGEVAKAQRNLTAFIDSATKNAPAGSENAVSLVRSAVAAANNVYETVQKAAKQAADVADANVQAITNSAMKATQQATSKVKRAASAD